MSQMMADTIPQLQAQISQITVMLNNQSLPPHVRQQTEMKLQQLQMELQQTQMTSALIQASNAAAAFNMHQQQAAQQQVQYNMNQSMMGMGQQEYRSWTNPFPNQQPAGQDSAYQRLPLNNRRRNLKRERPSDFLEVAGSDQGAKTPRYWE